MVIKRKININHWMVGKGKDKKNRWQLDSLSVHNLVLSCLDTEATVGFTAGIGKLGLVKLRILFPSSHIIRLLLL